MLMERWYSGDQPVGESVEARRERALQRAEANVAGDDGREAPVVRTAQSADTGHQKRVRERME
jgi:hypothetical protein